MESSILILTYNSSAYISNLLKSIKDFVKDSEVLVIDNASSDTTVETVKKFNNVKVIESGKNLGFAGGYNFGAKNTKSKYALFLNPDTLFKKGNLSDLIKVFKENPKAAVVGGKLIGRDGKVEKSAGKFFTLIPTILIALGLDEKFGIRFSPEKVEKVDFVSGGFMMVDLRVFSSLSGFDEEFFMYIEDMDFCYRVKKAGGEVYFTPDVVIEHLGHGSSNRSFAIVNIYKGLLYFHKKNFGNMNYQIVRLALYFKAKAVYLLGRITNNSYYVSTYGQVIKLF